jgi:hypothetical protein
MPHYLIHIGPHKTGTTYLQMLFRHLSLPLRERGVLYSPRWIGDGTSGHSRLAQRLQAGNDEDLAGEFDKLNASDYETVLISAEDLSTMSRDSIGLLKSYLRGQQVSVVFYVRDWLALLPSSWQENVKHGRSMTLPEFMFEQFMNPFASNTINYAVRLDPFEQAFGRENVVLVSYKNIVDQGGDLGEHFFRSFLSWPDAPLIKGIRPNPSLNILDIEVIRALNALKPTKSSRRAASYLNTKPELDLSIALAAMESHRQALRVNEHAPNLQAVHDKVFESYGNCLVPPISGQCFFFPQAGMVEYIKEGYLLMAGVRESLKAACESIRE